MGRVRPFAENDIPRVIELNTKLFPGSSALSPEAQRSNFMEVCLRNPWCNEGIESLVYVDNNDRVSGFIAVIPRKMVINGRNITVATLQHLMVDPESRSPFASMELFKAVMAGKQDISISDRSADIPRRLWEKCGGKTAYAYSTYWKSPLRPFTCAVSQLGKRYNFRTAAKISTPAFRVLDAVATSLPKSPWYQRVPETVGRDLTTGELVEHITNFSSKYSLRPQYDEQSLGWLLNIVSQQKRWGSLQKVIVCTQEDEVLGWFIYYVNLTGSSEVLQIGARENTVERVLSHLYYHAWKQGAIQLAGRMNPLFTKAFAKKVSFFFPGHDWMLIHSREPELMQPIFQAEAWLTRLDGDLWIL